MTRRAGLGRRRTWRGTSSFRSACTSSCSSSKPTARTCTRCGPGWTIVTPALTGDGRAVLVDRGQVPPDRLGDFPTPQGALDITGVIRQYRNGRAQFDPDNDPDKGQWFWWDIPAMLQGSRIPPSADAMPFVVQLLPDATPAAFPRAPEPRANLRNNHLGYAITWFGLALALAAVSGLYICGQMKKSTA